MLVVTAAGQLSMTISLGVVSQNEKIDKTVEKLVERTDAAMYQAKSLGKNRVGA
jgi:diguanylate cyclase (GGDEF)-like protein